MKKIIIYFLYRKRENADRLFDELVAEELLKHNHAVKLIKSYHGNRAIFEDSTEIQMYPAHENARGLWWSTAYIDCDVDPEIIQNVLIPSGKGSKNIHYFN